MCVVQLEGRAVRCCPASASTDRCICWYCRCLPVSVFWSTSNQPHRAWIHGEHHHIQSYKGTSAAWAICHFQVKLIVLSSLRYVRSCVLQGKVKSVHDCMSRCIDPTPKFDSHFSKNSTRVTSLQAYRSFEYTQVNELCVSLEDQHWNAALHFTITFIS